MQTACLYFQNASMDLIKLLHMRWVQVLCQHFQQVIIWHTLHRALIGPLMPNVLHHLVPWAVQFMCFKARFKAVLELQDAVEKPWKNLYKSAVKYRVTNYNMLHFTSLVHTNSFKQPDQKPEQNSCVMKGEAVKKPPTVNQPFNKVQDLPRSPILSWKAAVKVASRCLLCCVSAKALPGFAEATQCLARPKLDEPLEKAAAPLPSAPGPKFFSWCPVSVLCPPHLTFANFLCK